ncbi:MAG: putative ribosome biogenesis protein [candidate division WWE3 bacterium GW2011_GWF2_41_45]|uniref:Uncharacterized protein n=3 Tax=Katanobacteria TaxID=422282 RepID=A0A1F4W1P0_UNCKA|nr:MAG: putative ribosome biogenesis protein [candidate division WWE3 bacterium GW2011_GWC2_41_23]KKS10195.1 MAG: putative ribosome biogenesis protein [candidate division WWE3 bacterium GW2011_GWF2_41_45]KKS19540.1 MAG: putative ribosome biogenesis protein [candidate division WWE3 bacterium GW2011_GWE1_41_72]KKS28656.1 MAG: putative ribosome biogenesis protein [candidate division WWE3 bacterium GW2011_GWD2_42_11]KKS49842.1 MAG: putative ribosome biogenesis protein [candidate division WWE3 bacte
MLEFVLGVIFGLFLFRRIKAVIIFLVIYILIMLVAISLDFGPVNVSAFLWQGSGLLLGAYLKAIMDKGKVNRLEVERQKKEAEKLKNKRAEEPREAEKKEEEKAPEEEQEEEQEQDSDELPQLNEWKD